MKKIIILLFVLSITMYSQNFINSDLTVETQVFAYKLDSPPVIDGQFEEWNNIPWTKLHYNDRDFNVDGLIDPFPERTDFASMFKSAWVNGTNVIYFLIKIEDDQFHLDELASWYNVDGMEIRLDPLDAEAPGEPGGNDAFNIGFKVGDNTHSGIEGPLPTYQAVWNINESSFPKEAYLELSLTLPASLSLSDFSRMGFWLYVSDNDLNQDTSPFSKDAATVIWPQTYSSKNGGERIGVDEVWGNTYYWGNLDCIPLSIINVTSGNSIQTAISESSPGTIIHVEPGTYTENIFIDIPNLKLIADGEVILKPVDLSLPLVAIADDETAYDVTIEGFRFEGPEEYPRAAIGLSIGSSLAKIYNNQFFYFERPIIKGNVEMTNANAVIFEDNYLYENNSGINFNSPSTIIRYNRIVETNAGYGIDVKGTPENNFVDIAHNTVFNHRGECGIGYGGFATFTIHHNFLVRSKELYSSGDQSGDDGTENQENGESNDYIYNNTIVGWKSDGIQLGGSSTGASNYFIKNNIVAFCGAKDYDIRKIGTTNFDYNLSFGNGSEVISKNSENVYLLEDPLFFDVSADDFNISSESPAVDAGSNDPFGFKVQFHGSAVDLGAFEYGLSEVTSVEKEENLGNPDNYLLSQNYPNPFNPTTSISFTIPKAGLVNITVYDLLGQKMAELVNEQMAPGSYKVKFDAGSLTSGIYLYKISVNNFTQTKKMMLVK